jgi:hypothetical protein
MDVAVFTFHGPVDLRQSSLLLSLRIEERIIGSSSFAAQISIRSTSSRLT